MCKYEGSHEVLRLKSPFPDVMYVLGNPSTIQPIILPHRLAVTDPYKQITEVVGSGPLRFNKSDYVSESDSNRFCNSKALDSLESVSLRHLKLLPAAATSA